MADALAPLLDARHCTLSGECGALPAAGVGIADPFPLRLSVYVARAAFSAAAAAPSTNEGASAAAAAAQRYAFVRLLERLRVPQEVAPVDDASDGGAALEPPPAAAAPSAAAGDEEGTIDAGELDTLYERLGCDAAALRRLERAQPRGLKCTLHQYQMQGLGWLMERESARASRAGVGAEPDDSGDGDGDDGDGAGRSLPPAWALYRFADGSPLYANPSTGAVALVPPGADEHALGGILADEMGLGKTIQIISLILADRDEVLGNAPPPTAADGEPQAVSAAPAEAEEVKPKEDDAMTEEEVEEAEEEAPAEAAAAEADDEPTAAGSSQGARLPRRCRPSTSKLQASSRFVSDDDGDASASGATTEEEEEEDDDDDEEEGRGGAAAARKRPHSGGGGGGASSSSSTSRAPPAGAEVVDLVDSDDEVAAPPRPAPQVSRRARSLALSSC